MSLPDLSAFRARAQKDRLDLLQTDLDLSFTFTSLANTELEMGDRASAIRVYEKAEQAHAAIARFVIDIDDGPEKQAIERRLDELRSNLDTLSNHLRPCSN